MTSQKLLEIQKATFRAWQNKTRKRRRIPALPVGSHRSNIIVFGEQYASIAEFKKLGFAEAQKPKVGFKEAMMFAKTLAFGDRPAKVLDGTKTLSCHYRYYGIWHCVAEQIGSPPPLFCEFYPFGKNGNNQLVPANRLTVETISLLESAVYKRQIIVLNGVDVKNEGFFEREPGNSAKLQKELSDGWGVLPKSTKSLSFVTKDGFVCLRTLHSSGRGGTLMLGHLLEAVRVCRKFAARNRWD